MRNDTSSLVVLGASQRKLYFCNLSDIHKGFRSSKCHNSQLQNTIFLKIYIFSDTDVFRICRKTAPNREYVRYSSGLSSRNKSIVVAALSNEEEGGSAKKNNYSS